MCSSPTEECPLAHLEHGRGDCAHDGVPAHSGFGHGSHGRRDVDVEALGQHDEAGELHRQQLREEGLRSSLQLSAAARRSLGNCGRWSRQRYSAWDWEDGASLSKAAMA